MHRKALVSLGIAVATVLIGPSDAATQTPSEPPPIDLGWSPVTGQPDAQLAGALLDLARTALGTVKGWTDRCTGAQGARRHAASAYAASAATLILNGAHIASPTGCIKPGAIVTSGNIVVAFIRVPRISMYRQIVRTHESSPAASTRLCSDIVRFVEGDSTTAWPPSSAGRGYPFTKRTLSLRSAVAQQRHVPVSRNGDHAANRSRRSSDVYFCCLRRTMGD